MPSPKQDVKPSEPDSEHPDGWDRFERAVDAAIKSGPKHKPATKPKERERDPR